jgi:hypothetical protein
MTARIRRLWLRLEGYLDPGGELTPKGEQLAEESHQRAWPADDRSDLDAEPYPESRLY